jgi:hypothetical protein
MGTFWIDSERRCAVTTISSIPDDAAVSVSAAAAARDEPLYPLSIAEMAYASF